jgi:hypothetical protein
MKQLISISVLSALSLAAASALAATPDGKGGGLANMPQEDAGAAGQILFHGGPVMNKPAGVNVYLIWYGNWSGNTATTIVPKFVQDESGSPYFNINTTYYGTGNVFIKNKVNLKGQANDSYSHGTALTDANIKAIVKGAMSSGALPKDANGVYFVLTSADVNETSGFCTQYCGWHTHGSLFSKNIKYSFVGNPDRCLSACAAQSTSPNNNAGADGMVSIIAHELEESVTDPNLNAWYFATGNENADQCAWTFGTEYTTGNGSQANMNMNGTDYLIQQNWIQATSGRCAVAYP